MRQQLASAQNDKKQLAEKIGIATTRLESLLTQIPDEQKSLQEAVDFLNRKMQEIKDQGKINGLERIAIMAALNISHEFLTSRVGSFDVSEFKRRMNHIGTTLDQAMADQEKLF